MVIPVGGIAMTKRVHVESAPGLLEDYAAHFDDLLSKRAQREGFRRYLEGLLLDEERNKTLTALANTEPVVGAQRKEAQSLQWFLTESSWDGSPPVPAMRGRKPCLGSGLSLGSMRAKRS